MKKTKILLGLLIAYALNGCSLLGETEPDLPPATQTGANTIGFKVNGKTGCQEMMLNYRQINLNRH